MQVFTEEQKADLIRRLAMLERRGQIQWAPVDDNFEFRTQIGRFAYQISSRDKDDFAPYELAVIDTHTPSLRVPVEVIDTSEYANYNEHLQALYKTVKRRALGLTRIVDDVFREFDQFDDF
ncbi:hypothetical protein [Citricoccus sp. GCM10030269]|uniref:hypothetical protein n=1 Tax=Citricoccus sp. GCM10030269 TaxID=3273388 RepID=UPI003618BA84